MTSRSHPLLRKMYLRPLGCNNIKEMTLYLSQAETIPDSDLDKTGEIKDSKGIERLKQRQTKEDQRAIKKYAETLVKEMKNPQQ